MSTTTIPTPTAQIHEYVKEAQALLTKGPRDEEEHNDVLTYLQGVRDLAFALLEQEQQLPVIRASYMTIAQERAVGRLVAHQDVIACHLSHHTFDLPDGWLYLRVVSKHQGDVYYGINPEGQASS